MKRHLLGLTLLAAVLVVAVSCARSPQPLGTVDPLQIDGSLPEFNRLVLEEIATYRMDGTHGYWWPNARQMRETLGEDARFHGVTRDLYLGGQRVAHGEPDGRTFCCGVTLEAFHAAYLRWIEENGEPGGTALTPENWADFMRYWFVLEKNGPGPSLALEEFGLGRTINPEDALPGDFVQIWRRQGSGHSVIFLSWVRDEEGEISGFRYWSSQPGTDGIRPTIEYFAPEDAKRGMAWEHTHWGRVELQPDTVGS